MKAKVNKSQLFRRAWNIYNGNNPYSYSFSAALRRAWEVEKANVEYAEREATKALKTESKLQRTEIVNVDTLLLAGCTAYYRNSRPGHYFGD